MVHAAVLGKSLNNIVVGTTGVTTFNLSMSTCGVLLAYVCRFRTQNYSDKAAGC
jgi:hypothetical protein